MDCIDKAIIIEIYHGKFEKQNLIMIREVAEDGSKMHYVTPWHSLRPAFILVFKIRLKDISETT